MRFFNVRKGELILVTLADGTEIKIGAQSSRGETKARVGVEAPRNLPIVREELLCGGRGYVPTTTITKNPR